jgi:phenylalanyl-tRNA synthetase beta chain
MKFSLRWLGNYIELKVPVAEMLDRLTMSGTEVESVTVTGVESPRVVVAQILSSVPHPNADRLRVCQVDDGSGSPRQIVCGAKNYRDGDKAPLALPGAVLPGGFAIKESKLRGELSQGMLCSAKELALAEDAEGLLILPADAPVGKIFSEYQPGDTVFEVEITSNRPDLLSYLGLAREIAATGAAVLRTRAEMARRDGPAAASGISVELADPDLGPFYSAVRLTNVKVAPSPAWLQEAIAATGHRPINNVVDITNYVLFVTGQPLHAFDAAKLAGDRIAVRRARAGEKLEALDDATYELKPDDLVIADANGPVAIAGVMGGQPTGVSGTTTEVILETAWFAPATVRRTSRRLGLSSDSSYRYERRVDPGGLRAAREMAVGLLGELAGATVAGAPVEQGHLPPPRPPILLRPQRLRALLGVAVEGEHHLRALGCERISSETDGSALWQPPSFRDDLAREVDLIEEIARLHGLEAIPARLRAGAQPESEADRLHLRLSRLRHLLAARGWDECVTDALVERGLAGPEAVALANPLSELQTHLRPSLKVPLLQVAARNLAKGAAGLRLFEVGLVYGKREGATIESLHLGLVLAGEQASAAWHQPEREADEADLKGIVDFLVEKMGFNVKETMESGLIPLEDRKPFGLKIPVYYAEIDLTAWSARMPEPERFQPVPVHPSVRRDLAVVVGEGVPHGDVLAAIGRAQAPNLIDVRLFDIFRDPKGEKIAADRKSLAYALTYRAPDRTLTEKEVNAAQELIRARLVADLGCAFRE